ncbi:MAG: cysteine synthase [Armatimonadota bacterium]|nr:cysteine synthase [Armatimonadota bacterium]MDR7446968.1 cysteine synthase [Armatimonadota bacterium]MDR7525483.1 cysteine synthase [Armatimonadota bacterium]MDR7597243.1 cysteine synthase [Armatimonadota bacterium]MDR7617268.1 cysteine synthase [Armatimonadota bacterium]
MAYRFETKIPRIGEDLLQRIGNTPLLRLRRVTRGLPEGVEVCVKAEWFNPGGSVKDRPVLKMIEDAERAGLLTPDKVLLDSTSGNAGIAYAMIGAAKGYRVKLVMPANASEERKRMIRAYGAELVFSDPLEGSDGAILLARRIQEEDPDRYFKPDQYNNPSNWKAHYDTTGPEILAQTEGRITHFVGTLGTTGTVVGVGRRLREANPEIEIVAVEPDDPLHGIEGLKHIASSIRPGIYDPSVHHRKIGVSTEAAYAMARRLAREEGMFVGASTGAAVWAALQVARDLREGLVVALAPDGGDRYLSTALWRDV